MKEILKEFKNIMKTVFTKENLTKFMVYSFMALPLVLLFIGFFLVPSNAQITTITTSTSEYDEGYEDGYSDGQQNGYSQGYNDATNNIIDSLQQFNAISLYYESAYLFISNDDGVTWQNTSGMNYEITRTDTGINLAKTDSAPWSTTAKFYLDVTFTQPINLNSLMVPSAKHPNLSSVVVDGVSYTFTLTYINNVGYFTTGNMLSSLTNEIKLYFTTSGYMNDNSKNFNVFVYGYVNGLDSYDKGYSDGQESLQGVIVSLQDSVNVLKQNNNVLKNQVETLTNQLSQGNSSWYSLFFAMADTPFKTASNFLGFEIFGVNLFNALIGFITILAIFWVFKRLIK